MVFVLCMAANTVCELQGLAKSAPSRPRPTYSIPQWFDEIEMHYTYLYYSSAYRLIMKIIQHIRLSSTVWARPPPRMYHCSAHECLEQRFVQALSMSRYVPIAS